ncbi:polymer-forming cytoskeletal protein [Massilia putida]|uniref:polymer-forming cytoskeletal protein n=1 Tax=Massilia putida TaxID=1141883 RepID=UPI0009528EA5|nr:polymer-forming cytoskeletal protein [Massilia putida]
MLLRRFHYLLLALMLFAAGGAASAATTYTFGGGTIAGCTLSGTTYTCASLPLTGGNDSMVIASGFTVKITSNVSFGNNQSLTMSGNAVLASTGDIDIGVGNGSSVQINGGTLVAANIVSVGQKQPLTANIQAATVNADQFAEVYGDIVATKSFTLGDHGMVKGNVTAPIVSLSNQSDVMGNVTAKVSAELGNHVSVTGNVAAGTLTLDNAFAIIDGSATVDSAVLGTKGRVTNTIHCNGGTTAGKCDCVTNNSGYAVNTNNGPHCTGNTTALDHFLIRYDPTGSVCAPSTVTITACANADCTSTYGGGAAVTLAPTGQSVPIPSSGSVQASVTWPQSGTNTLGVSGATTVGPTACWSNSDAGPGASCQVKVASAAYTLSLGTAAGFTSDTPQTLTINALQQTGNGSCVPLFKNVKRTASFSCSYSNPSAGTAPVLLNGAVLRGQSTGSACDGGGPSMSVSFDANGTATLPLQYADAGQVKVTINDTGTGSPGTASVTPTFVPAKFQIALPGGPYVAGNDFYPKVTALNSNNNPTPNFGRESPAQSASLSPVPCQPNNNNGLLTSAVSSLANGVQTFKASWSEVGNIDLVASLTGANYLGTQMAPAAATTNAATPGCSGAAGPFSPAYFTFDVDAAWKRTATTPAGTTLQYYSGEPAIQLTVTARNAQNGVTQNYAGAIAHDLVFSAIDPTGAALTGAGGKFSRSTGYPASDLTGTAQIRALDFGANNAAPGTARWTGSYTFAAMPTAPTLLRVRVSELPSLPNPASSAAIPATVTAGVEPTLMIRSGRVRMPSRFGSAATLLKIPVSLEYYTGQTWVLNAEDSTTLIPAGAVSVGTSMGAVTTGLGAFAKGTATLSLTPPATSGRGSIPFALNLGTATANTSCFGAKQAMTPTTGAGLAFLRSADPSCSAAGAVDPSAMATFGVYAPENKRIIHVREVFR